MLKELNKAQKDVVLNELKGCLSIIIVKEYQLVSLLEGLNEVQKWLVLNNIKGYLPGIIVDGYQLSRVLKELNEAQKKMVLQEVELPSAPSLAEGASEESGYESKGFGAFNRACKIEQVLEKPAGAWRRQQEEPVIVSRKCPHGLLGISAAKRVCKDGAPGFFKQPSSDVSSLTEVQPRLQGAPTSR